MPSKLAASANLTTAVSAGAFRTVVFVLCHCGGFVRYGALFAQLQHRVHSNQSVTVGRPIAVINQSATVVDPLI